jgi:hypothetical protein
LQGRNRIRYNFISKNQISKAFRLIVEIINYSKIRRNIGYTGQALYDKGNIIKYFAIGKMLVLKELGEIPKRSDIGLSKNKQELEGMHK